jgi:hypothetical protein
VRPGDPSPRGFRHTPQKNIRTTMNIGDDGTMGSPFDHLLRSQPSQKPNKMALCRILAQSHYLKAAHGASHKVAGRYFRTQRATEKETTMKGPN